MDPHPRPLSRRGRGVLGTKSPLCKHHPNSNHGWPCRYGMFHVKHYPPLPPPCRYPLSIQCGMTRYPGIGHRYAPPGTPGHRYPSVLSAIYVGEMFHVKHVGLAVRARC